MNILLVNDDGVHAPGIKILRDTLSKIGNVYVVAPSEERSTTGHTLTLDHTIRLHEIENNVFACSGFPADCTLMGIGHLFKKKLQGQKIDIVVSGINRGANLGQDIFYSGTVAAAREAAFHGIASIAVSSCMDFKKINNDNANYYTASNFIKSLIQSNIVESISPMTMLNINVPWKTKEELSGIRVTKLGHRRYSEDIEERFDFRGRNYYWLGGIYKGFEPFDDSDCLAIEENFISVSPLRLHDYGDNHNSLIDKMNLFIEGLVF